MEITRGGEEELIKMESWKRVVLANPEDYLPANASNCIIYFHRVRLIIISFIYQLKVRIWGNAYKKRK